MGLNRGKKKNTVKLEVNGHAIISKPSIVYLGVKFDTEHYELCFEPKWCDLFCI